MCKQKKKAYRNRIEELSILIEKNKHLFPSIIPS